MNFTQEQISEILFELVNKSDAYFYCLMRVAKVGNL